MPAARRTAAVLLLALAASACGGGDDDADTAAATTTEATAEASTTTAAADTSTASTGGPATTGATEPATGGDGLPALASLTEDNLEGLQAVYGPLVEDLGLVVTRGGVVEYRGGTHLQLYVEPTTAEADNPPQLFLDRMLTSFQVILPRLFDAYPEMDSFDLCQEPVPVAGAAQVEPGYEEPVTLLLLTRPGYESVADWSSATLTDLFRAAGDDLDGYLSVAPAVAELPDYQAAMAAA